MNRETTYRLLVVVPMLSLAASLLVSIEYVRYPALNVALFIVVMFETVRFDKKIEQ